jgi:hypothetical protein
MYKSALAALTMTAAALLLAAVPALAGDDLDVHGPSLVMCDDGVAYVIKMGTPMVVQTTTAECADTDDDSHEYGLN